MMPLSNHLLAFAALICSATPRPESPVAAPDPEAYNVLVWVMDTTRADHFGLYGYPRDTTPTMDRLAEEGIYWSRATTTGSWTWPSVSSIMTSTAVPTHRNYDAMFALRRSLVAIPDLLNEAGYHTALFSSNILIMGQGRQLETRFDEALATPRPDAILAEAVKRTLRDQAKRPFFIYAQPVACHTPYYVRPPFDSLFVGDAYYGHLGDLPGINESDLCEGGMKRKDTIDDITSMDWYVSQYDGLLAYIDAQVESIFEVLDEQGLRENTLVILTADHAENLAGDHNLYFCHADHYQTNLHVPLIFILPERYQRERGPFRDVEYGGNPSHLDLMPTILDLLGIPGPPQMQGVSLLRTPKPPAHLSHNFYGRSLTSGDHKVVQHGFPYTAEEPTELYNLATDSAELTDLASALPDLSARMEQELVSVSRHLESLDSLDTAPGVFYSSDFADSAETDGYFHIPGKEPDTGLVEWKFERMLGGRRVLHGVVGGETLGDEIFANMSLIAEARANYSAAAQILLVSGTAALSSAMAGTLVEYEQEIYQGYQLTLSEDSIEPTRYNAANDTLTTGAIPYLFGLGVWRDVRLTADDNEMRVVIDGELVVSGFPVDSSVWGATKLGLAQRSEALFGGLMTWREL